MAIDQHDDVVLSVEGPGQQRRATVAFRLILAIPHLLWLALLGFVTEFAVIIAWFAALVLGRLPEGIGSFIGRVWQYYARVMGYLYLLTDEYPPFSLRPDDDYPCEIELDAPIRLNRAAVLFRLILMIPAAIVASLVSGGVTVVLVVVWLIVLISGRMPDTVFEAEATALRYQLRFYAYAAMLTPQYPGGLFGDKPVIAAESTETADLAAPPGLRPRITRLVLSKGAKRLVILFIIIGVFSNGASGSRFVDALGSRDAAEKLRTEHDQLDASLTQWSSELQTCAASADLSCLRDANGRLIAALRTFQADVREIDLPERALDEASAVDVDATEMITLLDQLQEASDPTQYVDIARRLGEVGTRFDEDFQRLYDAAFFS